MAFLRVLTLHLIKIIVDPKENYKSKINDASTNFKNKISDVDKN